MLCICSLAGETLKSFTAEEFEGQTVKSLKTLVAKQMGITRFQHRWLSKDHIELPEDAIATASDVQLVVLDFVPAEHWEVQELLDACKKNLPDRVEKLLRKPVSPDMKIKDARTALHVAAYTGSVDCLALLLEAGADKDASTFRQRMTALHFAAENGHMEVVLLLLGAGADKDASYVYGMRALDLAAGNGHLDVVRLFLEEGAGINVPNIYGTTSLHSAAGNGHPQVVRLLLEVRANKDVRDTIYGKTTQDLAAENGHQDVVQLLE